MFTDFARNETLSPIHERAARRERRRNRTTQRSARY